MNVQWGLTPKLTLVFVLFAALLLAGIGTLAYANGHAALEAAIAADLLSTAMEKEAALNGWVQNRQAYIAELANSPDLLQNITTFVARPDQAAHDRLERTLQTLAGPGRPFLTLQVIEADTGQVIAASDPAEEGPFEEDRLIISNGQQGPYVQGPYYSLQVQGLAVTAAAPLRSTEGRWVGVLAGRLNLAEMNTIIQRRTNLRQTDEAFLVNTSNLFVTQPRFITDPAVLQRSIDTEAVQHCLASGSGVISAEDYRGVPAIVAYRWLPERQLCLIVKVDQAEALAPARAFGQTILLIGGLVLLAASALAVGLARTITRPVLALQAGAMRLGRGELDVRLPATSGDELGRLAREFNTMAAALSEKEAQLRRYTEGLEHLVQERAAALRQSEASFRHLFTNHPHPMWVYDLQTLEFLEVNEAAINHYGYSRDEFQQMRLTDIRPPEDVPLLLEDLQQERPALQHSGLWRHRLKGGRIIDVDITSHILEFGGRKAVLVVALDITERKQAEDALAQERNLLRTLIDHIPDYIYVKDRESRFLLNNQAHSRFFGYENPEALQGKTDFDIQPAEFAARYYNNEQELIRSGQPLMDNEETAIDCQGRTRTVLSTKVPVRDHSDQIIGLVGVSRDITERKQAEEDLKQSAAELARSNAELEQFAYVASHDLQEPLRAVAGTVQLLQQRYQGQLDARADEFIAHAVDGVTRMQTLINDLLTYSRVGTRGQPFQPTDCTASLADALANLAVMIRENNAVVRYDALPAVLADPTQLTQLFQNLIGNAIKFRREAPPQVHISARPISDFSPQSAGWVFAVRDNGIGIEPQYFERIFGVFQRLHPRRAYPGTGIGLAICKKIVERHQGCIWLESEPGQGSIFYFTIPAVEPPTATLEAEAQPEKPAKRKDDPLTRRMREMI